jgi:hypothetical protein
LMELNAFIERKSSNAFNALIERKPFMELNAFIERVCRLGS